MVVVCLFVFLGGGGGALPPPRLIVDEQTPVQSLRQIARPLSHSFEIPEVSIYFKTLLFAFCLDLLCIGVLYLELMILPTIIENL